MPRDRRGSWPAKDFHGTGSDVPTGVKSSHQSVHREGTMGIVDRVKNILLSPKTEWPVIAEET